MSGPAPAAGLERPLFLLGVTSEPWFTNDRYVRAVMNGALARVKLTHEVHVRTGNAGPADRAAYAHAGACGWRPQYTTARPGLPPRLKVRHLAADLLYGCDAVIFFTTDPAGELAGWVRRLARDLAVPVRVRGPGVG